VPEAPQVGLIVHHPFEDRAACVSADRHALERDGVAVVIAEYLGETNTFDRAIVNFAKRYAEQNDRDYDALLHAVESGRLRSERGV
jgi:hypothetical protein